MARQDMVDCKQNRIGGRSIDRKASRRQFADSQRPLQRQGMAGPALLGLGGDHPDVGRKLLRRLFENGDARRVNAVVIGNEDTRFGEVDAVSPMGRQRIHSAHIGAKRMGNGHRSVRPLIIFQARQ